eukprot:CAMPEP_0196573976 /NCGR_PEP_ID=MMETSP1081-20130531/3784_1 /TAXON_ID=36882 /ORGANISM="Pyramimonas amylifera, Strain CCMP720" /LENGTH=205 /DNA_ID=CAMNT_0041891857 /DNA_START=256 /DNA_END=870 /DNA_ORIENTATION=+
MAPPPVAIKQEHPYASYLKPLEDLKGGCKYIFMDFGSNRGDSIDGWYEGEFLRLSKRRDLDPKEFCIVGFEPNPQWTPTLLAMQRKYQEQGYKVALFTETLAHKRFGTDNFYIDGLSTNSFGSSIFEFKRFKTEFAADQKKLDDVKGDMNKLRTKKVVWTVDAGVILEELARTNPGLRVFAKMDIEGSEFMIMPHLLMNYPICKW